MNLLDIMAGTSVNGRASVDPIVEAANAAFTRIEGHRKLFRRDWLPFLDGVNHLSIQAWEQAGRRTRLDRRPDWTDDRVQAEFRELTAALPWARFFDSRRTLLSVCRQIGGGARKDFLRWYDDLPKKVRERTGYPETLWRMFEKEKKKPDPDTDDDPNNEGAANTNTTTNTTNTTNNTTNDSNTQQVNAGGAAVQATDQARIRTDDERMAELVAENERWHDFGLKLVTSLGSGESTLKLGLRDELDRLLEGAA